MQQILVDLIALVAVFFLARMFYRSAIASRRNKEAACNGCGTCDAVRKETMPTDGPH